MKKPSTFTSKKGAPKLLLGNSLSQFTVIERGKLRAPFSRDRVALSANLVVLTNTPFN